MTYCNIDESGGRAIFEILIYQQSGLEEIILSGNHLRDEGVIKVQNGVSCNKSLKNVVLADNQFFEEDNVLKAIENCFKRNKTCPQYDFKHNFIGDDGVEHIIKVLEEANHGNKVGIPERISQETLERFQEQLKANAPKKGKKEKKKKKK